MKHVLITRYTWRLGRRPCEGPRGGRALREFARYVYYADGIFYRNDNVAIRDGEGVRFVNSLVPIDGAIWDAHPKQSMEQGIPVLTIYCLGGNPSLAVNSAFPGSPTDSPIAAWTWRDGIGRLESTVFPPTRRGRRVA